LRLRESALARRVRLQQRQLPLPLHHPANSIWATYSSPELLLVRLRRLLRLPVQKAQALRSRLILQHPAEAMVLSGLIPTHMFTTERGLIFTARPRRANT